MGRTGAILLAALLVAPLLLPGGRLLAQEADTTIVNTQLWVEALADKRLSQKLQADMLVGTRFLVSGQSNWTRFDLRPSLTYRGGWLVVPVGALFSFTAQTDDVNSFELRPFVGARFSWSPRLRFIFRSYTRLEYRYFTYSDDTNESSWRVRTRLEADIALNNRSLLADRTLKFLTDAEVYADVRGSIGETFNNRWRFRFGLGYRHSYALRIRFWYVIQRSRGTLDESFNTTDNIFRFRVGYYVQ